MSRTSDAPVCDAPDRHPVAPAYALPAKATDCHAHVFDADGQSQLDPQRSYSPSVAQTSQYFSMHNTLGIEHGVIVQPSVYGTDNRTTLDVVERNREKLRAVVVVDDNVSTLDDIYTFVTELGIEVVFDHFGHTQAAEGIDTPAINGLMRLLAENRYWVKLSGAYRVSACSRPPYSDVDTLAKALLEVNPGRLVWGSDWPHPQFDGEMPNDGALLDELARWIPDEKTRNLVLVDNPAQLYGF